METDKYADQIESSFKYYKPTEGQIPRYEMIRAEAKAFACSLHNKCPDSREKSIALTKLEEAVMWANASIARNEKE